MLWGSHLQRIALLAGENFGRNIEIVIRRGAGRGELGTHV